MTFNQWLAHQRRRGDPVGDLARDAAVDKRSKPRTRHEWRQFLVVAGASREALKALAWAWEEYQATGKS